MKAIRWILGRIILLLDAVFKPKSVVRHANEQAVIDEKTKSLSLYQYEACPFCVKARRGFKRHGLKIKTRDAKRDAAARTELIAYGGKLKVPCLKIEHETGDVEWLYESKNILSYIDSQFAGEGAARQQASTH